MDDQHYEIWFVTGSQHLYGDRTLRQVAGHARKIARALDRDQSIPVRIVYRGVMTTATEINLLINQVNGSDDCIGLIGWMHTFSPAKMWINGLKKMQKPMLHLHTQYNRNIDWSAIDMDYMNLNQSAHGGREFGFVSTRLGTRRKVVVGHWQDQKVRESLSIWSRVVLAWSDFQSLRIARFGDNMRDVAVTEGDKIEAQIKFGFSVNGYGLGDLITHVDRVTKKEVTELIASYRQSYEISSSLRRRGQQYESIKSAARIELGLRSFLGEVDCYAFTDTFENLTGLDQLPGLAVQRLMADGFGFAAEGDWKTAALVRLMKVMASGLPGGNSFMEDYTYHFQADHEIVLGAHMLEICPSITSERPSCEVHPLQIGGKADPVRLVFTADPGPAINISLIDLGHRFRMLVNEVEVVRPLADLPKLPVARACWKPQPNLSTAASAWILAGGAHHTCFCHNITTAFLEDFCEIADIELLIIDKETDIYHLKQALRWNEAYYGSRSRD